MDNYPPKVTDPHEAWLAARYLFSHQVQREQIYSVLVDSLGLAPTDALASTVQWYLDNPPPVDAPINTDLLEFYFAIGLPEMGWNW